MNALLVFVGGGIGAVARYWLQGAVYRFTGSSFPSGTMAVNVVGCLIIGVLMFGIQDRFLLSPPLRTFVAIGILGGFTTFSSFSFETIALLQEGELLHALLNVGGTVVSCLAATYAGVLIAKSF